MHVLIVDDTKSIHAFMDQIFEETSHKLSHVYSGLEAVDLLTHTSHPYDLVLLDWEMPGISGIDTLKKLRDQGFKTTILMVTSKNHLRDIQSALGLGASEYVMKPFTKDILFDKIEQAMGQKV
jgi:two-component system chemotaxis response regulator CheY